MQFSILDVTREDPQVHEAAPCQDGNLPPGTDTPVAQTRAEHVSRLGLLFVTSSVREG